MSKPTTVSEFVTNGQKILEEFKIQATPLRLGRIQLNALEHVKIDYFGTPSSVKYRIKAATQPDGSVILTPYNGSELKMIYEAILSARLQYSVSISSSIIKLTNPLPTTEIKQKIAQQLEDLVEQAKIKIRHRRHDLLNLWKQEFDNKSDEKHKLEEDLKYRLEDWNKQLEAAKQEELKLLKRV